MTGRNLKKAKPATSLYFIALIPDGLFREEVTKIKQYIQENYQSGHALRSPAHITLHMPFKWRDDRVDRLTRTLADFSNKRPHCTIELEGFGSFPPKVIFIQVMENPELNALQHDIVRTAAKKLKLENAQYKNRGFNPHMTVAFRDLKPAMFRQAWEEFRHRELVHSFEVRSIFLLKHNGKTWEIFREFTF